jgi:ribonuclease BN (tRNA processing enzyme)
VEEDLAATEPTRPQARSQPLERGLVEAGKQLDLPQRLDRRPHPVHRSMVHVGLSAHRQISRRSVVASVSRQPRYSPGDLPFPGHAAFGPWFDVRLTVLGCGPASPQPDTPASGLLVETGSSTLLLDCGQGVAARLVQRLEPARLSAVIIGHMHADHFIDLSALRYRFAWGDRSDVRVPLLLPPGGKARFAELAGVVSERDGFFDDAFEVREYDPATVDRIGDLEIGYLPGRHYVPAWGVSLTETSGTRIVYAGDTGPNPDLIAAADSADLLVCEATLDSADEDDPDKRGHLSLDEALEHGQAARARQLLITHYPSARREAMAAVIDDWAGSAVLARPDLVVEVTAARGGAAGSSAGGGRTAAARRSLAARQ